MVTSLMVSLQIRRMTSWARSMKSWSSSTHSNFEWVTLRAIGQEETFWSRFITHPMSISSSRWPRRELFRFGTNRYSLIPSNWRHFSNLNLNSSFISVLAQAANLHDIEGSCPSCDRLSIKSSLWGCFLISRNVWTVGWMAAAICQISNESWSQPRELWPFGTFATSSRLSQATRYLKNMIWISLRDLRNF